MNRRLNHWLPFVMLLALLGAGAAGCSTGATLRGQALEVQELNTSIHARAYRCAPQDLAIAESNVEFGLYELSQGDFVRARDHIYRAEEYAKRADALSNFEECLDKDVVVEVEKTPTVEVAEVEVPTPQAPEIKDSDGDGIPDHLDLCPYVAEDFDGFDDEDGCPEFDNDFDGITDINDLCPNVPEDFDGFQDEDGCPEFDNDFDGIPDVNDLCPDVPENFNGDEDHDGCPEERKLVKVEDDQIKLNEKVHFKTAKSDILASSYPLLNEVADVLLSNPGIHVRIEGHTDSRGKDAYNQKLSEDRAASVVRYLVGRGVDPGRMTSVGYGPFRPIEDNATETGRAANRRVEIHITQR